MVGCQILPKPCSPGSRFLLTSVPKMPHPSSYSYITLLLTHTSLSLLSLSLSPPPYIHFFPSTFLERERERNTHRKALIIRQIEKERDREIESMGSSSGQSSNYDLSFKILLIGDSAVGKSSLLVSFISNSVEDLSPTIGTFFFFFFFSQL